MLSFICLNFSYQLQPIAFSLSLLTTLLPFIFKLFHLHLPTMLNLASNHSYYMSIQLSQTHHRTGAGMRAATSYI